MFVTELGISGALTKFVQLPKVRLMSVTEFGIAGALTKLEHPLKVPYM